MLLIFFILMIFYPISLFADALFDNENFQVIQKQNTGAAVLDFNGDGFDDLFLYNPNHPEGNLIFRLNEEWPLTGDRYYTVRGGLYVVYDISFDLIYDVIPSRSILDKREGLLLLDRSQLYLIRYYDYEDKTSLDRDVFTYLLDLSEYAQVLALAIGDFIGGDVAYIAYRRGGENASQIDFINPVPVSIQNTSEINTVSRLFLYENRRTSHIFPLLVIAENKINESAGRQAIYFYAIDETTATKPVLTKIVIPPASELIHPDVPLEPVSLFQFDEDGLADLLLTDWKMMYYCLPGLNPESAISPPEWSLLK